MKHLAFILCLAAATAVGQTTPTLLPFQARLTDAAGAPVSNGVKLVQFRIYSQPSGGAPVWAGEIHRTTVNGGLVNVILGTKTPFTGVDFSQQLYLEATVDVNGDNQITSEDPPLLPRQIILPAIFAKEAAVARDASTLNGANWSSILVGGADPRSTNAFINAAKLQPGSLTGAQFAAGSISTTNIAPSSIIDANLAAQSIGLAALKQEIINQLIPTGTIMAWAGPEATVPQGWLLCNGQVFQRTDYQALFNAIGTSWGAGGLDGVTFTIPDLRGLFLRGTDQFTGRDPDYTTRQPLYPGGNFGNQVGSYQPDNYKVHTHSVNAANAEGHYGYPLAVDVSGPNTNPGWDNMGFYYGGVDRVYLSAQPTGGAESRPKNVAVNYIIKY
jgi:microcystin-dependent protein